MEQQETGIQKQAKQTPRNDNEHKGTGKPRENMGHQGIPGKKQRIAMGIKECQETPIVEKELWEAGTFEKNHSTSRNTKEQH